MWCGAVKERWIGDHDDSEIILYVRLLEGLDLGRQELPLVDALEEVRLHEAAIEHAVLQVAHIY